MELNQGKYVIIGPHGLTTPFDPDNDPDCELTSETTQEAIEELCRKAQLAASPGFAWGRRGSVSNNTWLRNHDTLSNRTGIPFNLVNGEITNIWVGNREIRTFDITIYHHTGDSTSLTSLVTVSVSAARSQTFDPTDFGTISVPTNIQLASKITSITGSNPADVNVYLIIKGDIA